MRTVEELPAATVATEQAFLDAVVAPCRPRVLRGLAANWPAVRASGSPQEFRAYLRRFEAQGTIEAFFGQRAIGGKYYYGDELRGFNFERRILAFPQALDAIFGAERAEEGPSVYIGSVPAEAYLPGFGEENGTKLAGAAASPRIWLGHASTVSGHYDAYDNLAIVVAGKRRFTLYAPELIGDLYIGPIDHTMAGQPISLAMSAAPGDPRYTRFDAVRDQALVVELEPGDALYLPKLWWHQVEATAAFNGLVNYWWDAFKQGPDAPYAAMLLAMITLAERPAPEREAWRAYFDHYVFRGEGHPLAHLPEDKHGVLGPLQPDNYGRLRALVMHMLRSGY